MIGIIGAMDEEVSQLRELLKQRKEKKIGGTLFYSGILDDNEVVLVKCRVGKVSAASATSLLLREYQPEWVVNTGSAGGLLSGTQRFGDILIPDQLAHHDVDVTAFGYLYGQLPGLPQTFETEKKLCDLAESVVETLIEEGSFPPGTRHHRGLLVSGDSFIADPSKVSLILKNFPKAIAVEMEAAAIGQVCRDFEVPFLVTRSLSDIAGTESPMSFAEFLPIAAANSALMVRRLILEKKKGE